MSVGTKAHIMIIDDEAPMRGLLKDFLESQGYQVSSFSSASTAIKFLRDTPKTDAIISDIQMSPMNGLDLLRIIKRDLPRLPVLLFTAAGSVEERAQSLKLGAEKYFIKPFPLTELKSSLEQLLAKQASTFPLITKGKP